MKERQFFAIFMMLLAIAQWQMGHETVAYVWASLADVAALIEFVTWFDAPECGKGK